MTGMNYQKIAQARRAWSQGRIELSENKSPNPPPKKKRKKRKPEGPIGLLAAEIAERVAPSPPPEKFRGGRMRSKSSPGRVLSDEEKAELAQKYIAMLGQPD